jgi:2-polyprenyl-3-methyl-5-hydroxy-6-metoxy-1,4-benzoquinol methylase
MAEYNRLAWAYSQRRRRSAPPSRHYVLVPSLFAHLPDLTGKRVLDLGCGDGYFTEMLKEHGASVVVGVDASAAQIQLTEAHAAAKQLDIRYLVLPVEAFPFWTFDRFDVMTAVFLLHYAQTKSAMEAMCHTIANAVQST